MNCLVIVGLLFNVLFAHAQQKNGSNLNKEAIEQSMVKALEWQEQHPIYALAPTDWTNGAYYTGVTKAHQATQNQVFLAALKTMGYRNEWKPLYRTYHADDIAIAYSYLYINTTRNDLVDLTPTREFLDDHLFKPNDWKTGEDEEKRILWWWCDALFMAPPVIAYYSAEVEGVDYLDEMHAYYQETYNLLFDQEEKLFARDVRFVWDGGGDDLKEPNGKKIFWSRGNGWVLGGLALLLEKMPDNYEHRSFYEDLFKAMAARIKELQPKDGLWRVSLLHPEGYDHGEVSGSGFFTYAMAWGVNNGLLDKQKYTPVVLKAWDALAACQQPSGKVGWVQNIGFDPKPATEDSWQNYGTGAFLLAGSEVIKLISAPKR